MKTAAVVNGGGGSWAFEDHAKRLSRSLWVDISSHPCDFNYYLHLDDFEPSGLPHSFIPTSSMEIAADKRKVADAFSRHRVPSPETHLLNSRIEIDAFLRKRTDSQWCLKWPTGCGATGHKMLTKSDEIESFWPAPFVVQKFIPLPAPEVYRTYCVDGQIFGWTLRKFGGEAKATPWVSHAKGARYQPAGPLPEGAKVVAKEALSATGLLSSFGCVDFLRSDDDWLALEVGTDGMFNHVDRDFSDPFLEDEINRRLAEAFWKPIGIPPWAPAPWHYKP